MDERGDPDEAPWEVSEYRYEPPAWLDILFNPAAGLPLAGLVLIALWRWLSGS
jgi:hypothetical protein